MARLRWPKPRGKAVALKTAAAELERTQAEVGEQLDKLLGAVERAAAPVGAGELERELQDTGRHTIPGLGGGRRGGPDKGF